MILSLDPGSSKVGWAIVNFEGDIVSLGFISPSKGLNGNIPFNLKMNLIIKDVLGHFDDLLYNRYREITHVAWEVVPSFGKMGQRELVQATANTLKVLTFQKGLPYQQFTPRDWHKKFVGKASCTKDEVKKLVLMENLKRPADKQIPDDLPYDTYDAIAIGLTASRYDKWIDIEHVS